MKPVRLTKTSLISAALVATLGTAGCGRADLGRSSSQVAIDVFEAASGAEPDDFGNTLDSDVLTLVERTVDGQQVRVPTVFDDVGRVQLRVFLRDAGTPGNPSQPSNVNGVTFNRYRVTYRRADGRNTQGVDVPYAFDSAFTLTIAAGGSGTAGFQLVRHTAKMEAPLAALVSRETPPIGQPQKITVQTLISTIADVEFFGKDLAGNDVTAKASIGITFGDFGDPE